MIMIRIQKILRFVPGINLILWFAWPFVSRKHGATSLLKKAVVRKEIIVAIVFGGAHIVTSRLIQDQTTSFIVRMAINYLFMTALSCISVAAQEQLLNTQTAEGDSSS
jgi:hypothetical protein